MDVLVTGAGKGLGLSFARVLLGQGHRVFAGYLEAHGDFDSLGGGERLCPVSLDVRSDASVREAVRTVSAATRSLDMVINNAAIFPDGWRERIDTLGFSGFQECFEVNSTGPLRVIGAFLPLLERGTGKTLVTVSSESGSIGGCGSRERYAYSMSKAALDMGMKILWNDLSPRGYALLILHPGWLQTDMGRISGEPDVAPDASAADILALAFGRKREHLGRLVDRKGVPMPW